MTFKEKLLGLNKYIVVATFLSLEVFAFIAFSFGNSFILFGALSLALMILLIIFSIKEINVDGMSNVAILFLPLFLYVLLTALGIYSKYHIFTNDFNIAEVVFVPIGIISIAMCGYLLSLNKTFKLKTFFIVIYSALGFLVLLNLLVNLVNFGFFYPWIYKGYYMYFGGLRSSTPVHEMAYVLEGFSFIETKMEHYALYPLLLLSSSFFLFYTSIKEEKKLFILYVSYTALGLLSILFVPSLVELIGILIIASIDLLLFFAKRYEKVKKITKYVGIAILILFILGMSFFFLIHQSFAASLGSFVKNNPLLNKLFVTNRFVSPFVPMIENLFLYNRFFGYYETHLTEVVTKEAHLSGSYVFDNLMTSGVIGAFAFLFILLLAIKGFGKYLFKVDEEEFRYKGMLFIFFASFYLYSLLYSDGEYGIFYSITKPIYMTGPFMLTIFMIFYSYSHSKKGEEIKHE